MNIELHNFAKQQADFCAIFGNAKRILILWELSREELSVSELAEEIGTSLQNTSQHLRLMKDRNVVFLAIFWAGCVLSVF